MTQAASRPLGVATIQLASVAVFGAALLASFRLGFGVDFDTALVANGARVGFAAAAGAALALGGAVRLRRGAMAPLDGLAFFLFGSGAAVGAWIGHAAGAWGGAAVGALVGAGLGLVVARGVSGTRRVCNLGVAALLVAGIAGAALAGSYGREDRDALASVVAWLLGDLSGATLASATLLLAVVAISTGLVARALSRGSQSPALAGLTWGVGIGAAGLLAFVASLVPRVVDGLVGRVSAATFAVTCALAGAATVVAVDSVTRLLVGGYDFPFNVPAAIVATPFVLVSNRRRLRAAAPPPGRLFEWVELGGIALLVVVGVALAAFFTGVIASAT